ncbi:MAG: ParB N-terminal domain-containing protein [Proteobacteria bacterium]|nr:ParB N-terminal domain-containing protein [Pseudomonadota bacterium]
MTWKEEIIHLSSIDIEDHTFRITTEEDIESLSCSISNAGLINPPIVISKKSGYAVISGFRRIKSVQNLGWPSLIARVLDTNTTFLECAKVAVTDNLMQHPLNLIETSRAYKVLSGFFDNEQDLLKTASILGLPDNQSLAEKIIKLCDMPLAIQNSIISNTVSLVMALELGKMENDAGIAIAELFEKLKPGLNKQREILTLLYEIASREGVSIIKLLNGEELQDILSDTEPDRNQKINKLRQYLKRRRYPLITKAEKVFERNVRKLELERGMKIIPPANFEGNTFVLSLEFKTITDLEREKEFLDKLIKNPTLEQIISKSTDWEKNH